MGVAAGYSDGNILNVAVEAPTVEIVQEDVAAYDEDLTTNL